MTSIKAGPEPLGLREIVKRLERLRAVYLPNGYSMEQTVQAALKELGGTPEALRRFLVLCAQTA